MPARLELERGTDILLLETGDRLLLESSVASRRLAVARMAIKRLATARLRPGAGR